MELRVKSRTLFHFAIAERVNLAYGKPAEVSSVVNGAWVAVDGDDNTQHFHFSCIHTSFGDTEPWWRVDLEHAHWIAAVELTNRGDCCGV